MTDIVRFDKVGGIGVVTIDNPPVNALSQAVRAGIQAKIKLAEADADVAGIVIACAGRTFIAGADITEFGKPPLDPSLPSVLRDIMACKKIVVAALHGTALGGGFEVALACHYRCASPLAKVGLPEVTLGILPGAGGTQRLPRLIGPEAALDMIVSGKPVGAHQAARLGAIDHIIDGDDLLAGAIAFTAQLIAGGAKRRRVDDINIERSALPENFFADYRKKVAREKRGFFAPLKCIDAVEAAVSLPIDAGLRYERELFMQCIATTESKAQRYAFFAERQAAAIPDIPKDTPVRPLKKVGVAGAGTMGGGIAMNFANVGIPVTIIDMKQEALDRGLGIIADNYQATVRKGRLSQEDAEKRIGLIKGSLDYADLADVDLVIEAVFENLDVKKQVFAKLDAACKPGAILASNTSTLDVDDIASVTKRPQDVIGLHFFSPANVMKLLEVVRGAVTAKDVVATTVQMARMIGKVGVLSRVCYGFIGNRMLEGYAREACYMLLEGASPQQIDKAIYDFGFAMGPFAMFDLAGVDVSYLVRQERRKAGQLPDDPLYYLIADKVAEMGRYGQKTGRGFYVYEPGRRTPLPDAEIERMIRDEAARHGVPQKTFTDAEIVARCIYPLINEGALILEEGIAIRPGDIDTVWLNGYGFPVYRGGPMFYADTIGLKTVYDQLLAYESEYGALHWKPAPLLARLVAEGKNFGQLKA